MMITKKIRAKRKENTQEQIKKVMRFANVMLKYHSDDSVEHFQHVRRYTKMLCLKYNEMYPEKAIPESNLEFIYEGAQLHDIGKISVPDDVLYKEGELTPEELEQLKRHCTDGAKIVDSMADICGLGPERAVLHNICLYHHERYDGSGYPEGLVGDAIPLEAQIVAIAEVYDKLTTMNFGDPLHHGEAMRKIIVGECGAFRPDLLRCLESIGLDLKVFVSTQNNEERQALLERFYSHDLKKYWRLKRALDICFSLTALIVFMPLMLLIALAIFIDDPKGSPIFKQTRLGRHKKPFTMYKFRTMVVDVEARKAELEAMNEKDGPVFKIADDPRITRVGRILRKTSLDEMPQLWNILKGDMAIVGPRPPLPSETQQYNLYQEIRLSVTPGLTCDWQVQPDRDSVSFDDWVDLDVGYIGARSLRKDISIIFRTVLAVVHHTGH